MHQRLISTILVLLMMGSPAVGVDVGTFLAKCEPPIDAAAARKKVSAMDEKNFFWCVGHIQGILDGYRIGLLAKGDLNFAYSLSICPPKNTTDVESIIIVLNELEENLRDIPKATISKSTELATAVTAILSIKWPCR